MKEIAYAAQNELIENIKREMIVHCPLRCCIENFIEQVLKVGIDEIRGQREV